MIRPEELAEIRRFAKLPLTRALLDEIARLRNALESIRNLPKQFGHFDSADAATAAVALAKEALEDKQ
jgi:hypothetical protein